MTRKMFSIPAPVAAATAFVSPIASSLFCSRDRPVRISQVLIGIVCFLSWLMSMNQAAWFTTESLSAPTERGHLPGLLADADGRRLTRAEDDQAEERNSKNVIGRH